jgi:hypothetical protein
VASVSPSIEGILLHHEQLVTNDGISLEKEREGNACGRTNKTRRTKDVLMMEVRFERELLQETWLERSDSSACL